MLKPYAEDFYQIGALFSHLRTWFQEEPLPFEKLTDESKDDMAATTVQIIADSLIERLGAIELEFSVKALQRLKESTDDGKRGKRSVAEVAASIKDIDRRIRDELGQRFLLFVSPENAKRYNSFQSGWTEAIARFNGINTDVEEAEKCFALGRYSACVFHLMRVAEIGVQVIGKRMKLPAWRIQEPWGKIIKAVHEEVLKMPHRTTSQKKKQRDWSLVADALFQVNLAWRIPTEHPRVPGEVYTEEQAEEAIGRVKSLMRHLACMI